MWGRLRDTSSMYKRMSRDYGDSVDVEENSALPQDIMGQETTDPSWKLSLPHILVATIVSFLFGYHIGVVNEPLESISIDLGFSGNTLAEGLVVSTCLAGAFIRSLLSGWIAVGVGRRKAFQLCALPMIIGASTGYTKHCHSHQMSHHKFPMSQMFSSLLILSLGLCFTDKSKANVEPLEHQPPHKKVTTDGPMVVVPSNNSFPSDIRREPGIPVPSGDSNAGSSSSSSRQIPSESISGSRSRGGRGDNQALKMAAVLNQAWKDDPNSGRLLVSLFELFGESIFNFIPTTEMSFFL